MHYEQNITKKVNVDLKNSSISLEKLYLIFISDITKFDSNNENLRRAIEKLTKNPDVTEVNSKLKFFFISNL